MGPPQTKRSGPGRARLRTEAKLGPGPPLLAAKPSRRFQGQGPGPLSLPTKTWPGFTTNLSRDGTPGYPGGPAGWGPRGPQACGKGYRGTIIGGRKAGPAFPPQGPYQIGPSLGPEGLARGIPRGNPPGPEGKGKWGAAQNGPLPGC